MSPRDRRRLRVFVLLVAVAATLAVPAGAWLLLQDWARARLTEGMLEHGREVQREVRETVAYAAELGIPLDAEEVVHSGFVFLAGVLRDNPQVRFIAVARPPPGVDLVFYEGTNRHRLGRLLADPAVAAAAAAPGGSGDRAVPVGNFAVLVEPLALAGEPPFAVLHVGIDRRFADARLERLAMPLVLAVLAGVMLALQAGLFAVDGLVAPPLDRLAARLAGAGLARAPRGAAPRRRDEVRVVLRAHGAVIDRLRDASSRLLTYADEVRREVLDPNVAERVGALRDRTEAELGPMLEAAQPAPDPAAAVRLQPALFALTATAAALSADPLWRAGLTVPAVWPALLALALVAVALLAGKAWPGPVPGRAAAIAGAALAAVAAWTACAAPPGAWWGLAASFAAALGLALVVALARPRGAAVPLLLGAPCGIFLAGSLAGVAGPAASALAAALAATAGLAAAVAFAPAEPETDRPCACRPGS